MTNTKREISVLVALMVCCAASAQRVKTEPLIPSATLSQLMPSIKMPAPVVMSRNVFGLGGAVSVPLQDESGNEQGQQIEEKMKDVMSKYLSSVIRQRSSPAIILFDGKVFRLGDELFLGKSNEPQPLLAHSRVILDAVTTENLELTVQNSDGRKFAQGEKVNVPLKEKYQK